MEQNSSQLAWATVGVALAAGIVMLFGQQQPQPIAEAGDRVIEVRVEGMRFVPDVVTVPQGQSVRIALKNTGTMVHDLLLAQQQTRTLQPGERDAITLTPSNDEQGWCTVPGHKQAGMVLHLKVIPGQAG